MAAIISLHRKTSLRSLKSSSYLISIFYRGPVNLSTPRQFLNIPGYKKLLYCALVTWHPFDDYPPLPVAEYITSDPTKDSIYLFLSHIQKNLLSLFNLWSNMKPKLIMTEFSLTTIHGVLKAKDKIQYNRQNIKEYLEKYFEIIIEKEKFLLILL